LNANIEKELDNPNLWIDNEIAEAESELEAIESSKKLQLKEQERLKEYFESSKYTIVESAFDAMKDNKLKADINRMMPLVYEDI